MTCPSQTHCPRHVRRGNALRLYSEIHKVHIFALPAHNTRGYFYNTKYVEYYLWFCNHPSCACVCVSWNLFFLSVFGQSKCIWYCILYCVWWSSIHLYLIWSGTIGGTMCEREALSIRMGGGQHIELDTTVVVGNTVVGNTVVGNTSGSTPQSSGGNENHYVAIDHPLLKVSHHYFTLHNVTIENTTSSKAQKERCQTHHDET